jgi:predicted transglutaminase-like cysteine proteinase
MKMRCLLRGLVLFAVVTILNQSAQAAFFSYPRALGALAQRIQFDNPTLPPFAHSLFCVQYASDCQVHRMAFRGGKVPMTMRRWLDLVEVNADVNHGIIPERNELGLAGERWVISPARGDCNDYAVTKRHELLMRGWPSRALLLAEVATSWGEHHLILVIHVREGDFVADNLNPHIRPWTSPNYQWMRMQTPANPQFWATIRRGLDSREPVAQANATSPTI